MNTHDQEVRPEIVSIRCLTGLILLRSTKRTRHALGCNGSRLLLFRHQRIVALFKSRKRAARVPPAPVYPCGCFCSAQMPPKTSTRSTGELIDLVKTCENTLLAFDPTSLIVPTTRTRITANMTAYSAMSWPSSVLPNSPSAYNQCDTRTSYAYDCGTIRMRTISIGNPLWVRM